MTYLPHKTNVYICITKLNVLAKSLYQFFLLTSNANDFVNEFIQVFKI